VELKVEVIKGKFWSSDFTLECSKILSELVYLQRFIVYEMSSDQSLFTFDKC